MATKKNKNQALCMFFLRGACNKGDSCQYSHKSASLEDLILCNFHKTGTCRYGEFCQYLHGDMCPHCRSNCLHPHNKQFATQHLKICEQKTKLMSTLPVEVQEASSKVECAICYEVIASKGDRFGLMTGCDHAFCVKCIRHWRNKTNDGSNTKTCPCCRQDSLFIVPSLFYCTGELKRQMVEQYKANLKLQPCRYYAKSANCPFGSDCFYAHVDQNGAVVDSTNMKNIIKCRQANRAAGAGNHGSRLDFHSYEMDVVNLLSQLSHMSPQYVMELLMDMLADEDEDWVDY